MVPRSLRTLAILTVLGIIAAMRIHVNEAFAFSQQVVKRSSSISRELSRLYAEDQADRMPSDVKSIDWSVVSKRDREREARVKELYSGAKLETGPDYYHAAMILQHASEPDDFLLAHEFCIVAISKGEKRALWLAAASEDRFLMNINRPQRFGTQYRSSDLREPMRLYEVDPKVTNALRRELHVPSIEEARKREAEINRPFSSGKR